MHHELFNQILTLNIFDSIKNLDPILKGILSSLILTLFATLSDTINLTNFNHERLYEYFIYIFGFRKSQIILTGQKEQSFAVDFGRNASAVRCDFSSKFSAIMIHIIENIKKYYDIRELKETSNFEDGLFKENFEKYIVDQKKPFCIDEKMKIYAKSRIEKEDTNNEKITARVEKYELVLYSYSSNLHKITEFVDNMTNDYVSKIQNSRKTKKYCYTLIKSDIDNCLSENWNEVEFKTTRSFKNMFFAQKHECLQIIDFFENNQEWYYEMGIPYTLGFGLYGNPGTGKTSFIKSLAEKTNRHVINISLKLIKTKQQLENIFFERMYSTFNRNNLIDFEKKIIIFEDIDCIGDLVKEREKLSTINKNDKNNDKDKVNEILSIPKGEDILTLDDFLNLLDGVRETPGRIIVLTSNFYDKLDRALIRPGRIDKEIEMKNVNRNIIKELANHFYKKNIKNVDLEQIEDEFYSAAEITNIYLSNITSFNSFVNRLKENKHVSNFINKM